MSCKREWNEGQEPYVRSAYAEANTILRDLHHLLQLRKFQAERRRSRAINMRAKLCSKQCNN
ncbi:hypothetical protein PsorP6_013354 [Peronosclerospora sorghi]|uniref:Uncharacterized protein n=1 Tax=Peronosclerospora sorghi TaxID=230839 RepID=A0ACC0WI87_9STRA|nr:hypothetical protein PsorP6_013354 [Peronosclerospora sorghi]